MCYKIAVFASSVNVAMHYAKRIYPNLQVDGNKLVSGDLHVFCFRVGAGLCGLRLDGAIILRDQNLHPSEYNWESHILDLRLGRNPELKKVYIA